MLNGSEQLTGMLQQSWKLLHSFDAHICPAGASAEQHAKPRALQQRFAQRRAQVNTVSVGDLKQLSSVLCGPVA